MKSLGVTNVHLGSDVCSALIGMHAFTGCDTVSALAGKGNITRLKILKHASNVQGAFKQLGKFITLSSDVETTLEAFTCKLYNSKSPVVKVNDLRYILFSSKKGEIDAHQLPTCADALHKHCLRANYQALIWRHSLDSNPEIPHPSAHGWKIEYIGGCEELIIDWIDGATAPYSVLSLLSCKCSRKCILPHCTCLFNGLKCSEMCKKKNCDNQPNDDLEPSTNQYNDSNVIDSDSDLD